MRLGDHRPFRFLIRDGAGQFTRAFDTVLAAEQFAAFRLKEASMLDLKTASAGRLGGHVSRQWFDDRRRDTAIPSTKRHAT